MIITFQTKDLIHKYKTGAYKKMAYLKSSPNRAPWWLQVYFLSLVVCPGEWKLLWAVVTGLECF